MSHPRVFEIMKKIREQHAPLFKYNGLGYCGYLSTLLQLECKKQGLNGKILHGTKVKQTELADNAVAACLKGALSISDNEPDLQYRNLKLFFKRHQDSVRDRMGHAVFLFNGTCYDPTFAQFGDTFSLRYPVTQFFEVFGLLHYFKVTLTSPNNNFGILSVVKTPVDEKMLINDRIITSLW